MKRFHVFTALCEELDYAVGVVSFILPRGEEKGGYAYLDNDPTEKPERRSPSFTGVKVCFGLLYQKSTELRPRPRCRRHYFRVSVSLTQHSPLPSYNKGARSIQ